jgi:hypothetical protein
VVLTTGYFHRNLRSYARRSMLEKREIFSVDLHPTYFVKWREALYIDC